MAQSKNDKRNARRKAKQKERHVRQTQMMQRERLQFLFQEAVYMRKVRNYDEALGLINRVLRISPGDPGTLKELSMLGALMGRPDLELKGLFGIYKQNALPDASYPGLCTLLFQSNRLKEALEVTEICLSRLSEMRVQGKMKTRAHLEQIRTACRAQLSEKSACEAKPGTGPPPDISDGKKDSPPDRSGPTPVSTPSAAPKREIPRIPVILEIDQAAFRDALKLSLPPSLQGYELSLQAHQVRLKETFDRLICLPSLRNIQSFWYQEETARKVLKRYRGRALLADEVGLGKTIEALIVLKEYIRRGMVKSALILVPTPLVSQWRDELREKFGLEFPSTDDPGYRARGDAFWQEPFIVSSINLAKSKKNYDLVTGREYDLVIVDEAHHLKNKTTQNWKLVNDLKKRFLLLLTATPVENNLLELYNLITLLKPGQLRTASAFREEFMTRGEPTDPKNRDKLRELLGEVMIRNTRAVAKIDIPPRFAHTIRVEPAPDEKELYAKITAFVRNGGISEGGSRMLLKTLLEEAGSSPRAVDSTLSRLLERQGLGAGREKEIRAVQTLCRTAAGNRKNKVLLDLIRSSEDKAIVFVKYLGTLEFLSDFFRGEKIPFALFHGGMPNDQKDEQIRQFREEKPVLLTTEIGGEGRNLQFCNRMVNYDLPWNPMKIEQRIGRIHRIGQKKEVSIYNLCTAGSLEDYILEILDKKINMFEMVIGEIDMILGRIKGEQEFSEMVFDIWVQSDTEDQRSRAFGDLAATLKRLKTGYEKTKSLDEKLFGETYEL
jgi:superfamily II DNA or RNA helicase